MKHPTAFLSYKGESEEHSAWVRKLATDLCARGIDAILDQWEVRLGDSFTDYMQKNISSADILLFVITSNSVRAAEAPDGEGGPLKFEVQMMNARRIREGTRIIGIYRDGDRPPNYLRDHRYVDFRNDESYAQSLHILVNDLSGISDKPPINNLTDSKPIWPDELGTYVVSASEDIPPFPDTLQMFRFAGVNTDFWGKEFICTGSIRIFDGAGWDGIYAFPHIQNHCTAGLFMIRWRCANPQIFVNSTLSYSTDLASDGDLGISGYMFGTNCEQPLFKIETELNNSGSTLADIFYELKFWQAAP